MLHDNQPFDKQKAIRALLEALAPYEPRLVILAGYMRLVTPVLLGHFYAPGRLGVVNIHPADTRAYQGAHGYEYALGMTPGQTERLSETFGVLADPTRLRIVYAIRDQERSVGQIAQLLGLSEPSVSQHLRQLRQLRMVRHRAQGRNRFYQLDDDHVATLLTVSLEHVRGG